MTPDLEAALKLVTLARHDVSLTVSTLSEAYIYLHQQRQRMREELSDVTAIRDGLTVARDNLCDSLKQQATDNQKMREALKRAGEALLKVESETVTVGTDYGMPEVAKFARQELLMVRAALAGLVGSTTDEPKEPRETRNSKALRSFTEYCQANPSQRFWQALRNWSPWNFILAANDRSGATLDTFYLEDTDIPNA